MVNVVFSRLTEREGQILISRFGLEDGEPKTLEQVGSWVGVSRERIRQIVSRCLRKLRDGGSGQARPAEDFALHELFFTTLHSAVRDSAFSLQENLDFIHESFFSHLPKHTHFFPLVVALAFGNKSEENEYAVELLEYEQHCLKDQKRGISEKDATTRLTQLLSSGNFDYNCIGQIETAKAREATSCSWAKNGKFYSELLKREVEYESGLELKFCELLESSGLVKSYQEQPIEIPYSWKDKTYNYYPDFYVSFESGVNALFEIKPIQLMVTGFNLEKWEALKKFSKDHQIACFYTDGYKTLDEITSVPAHPAYVSNLLELIEKNGSVNLTEFKQVKDKFGANIYDLLSFIVNEHILFDLRPFRLSRPSSSPSLARGLR